MTDDRAEFVANRDAGLVKRHEQRLARARELGRPEECLAHRVLGITPHICLLMPGHEGDHVWTADRELEPQPEMVGGSRQPPRGDATYPMDEDPVTDMVIPPEAREAARAAAIDRWMTGSADSTQMLLALDAGLEAALPHLRPMPVTSREPEGDALKAIEKWYADMHGEDSPMFNFSSGRMSAPDDESDLKALVETATRLGRELGRREMAEEIALALEAEAHSDYDAADDLRWAAMKAREIATKEPK